MWQPSPDMPDIDTQTDGPEDISEPQATIDTWDSESVGPQAPVNTQVSSEQTSFDLGPSVLPMLDQNKDKDGKLIWKQPTVPQSNTLSDEHHPHSFVNTIAIPEWSYSQALEDQFYSHFGFSLLNHELPCSDNALKWDKVCKTLGDKVHKSKTRTGHASGPLCPILFKIIPTLKFYDNSVLLTSLLEPIFPSKMPVCCRQGCWVIMGYSYMLSQASSLQTAKHHG